MAEETLDAIKSKDTEIVSNMHDLDINLDKFQDYCIRILTKTNTHEPRKASILFSTLFMLELIGDEFKSISNHLMKDFKQSSLKEIEEIAQLTKNSIDTYYELFYKFDNNQVSKITEADKKTHFSLPEKYKKLPLKEQAAFHHFRLIIRYLNALVELRIEMQY